LIPANTGCVEPDPALNLHPVMAPMTKKSAAVLTNSFGFGGNNACLVLGDPGKKRPAKPDSPVFRFEITGSACVTGAGDMEMTLNNLEQGRDCRGTLPLADISKKLPAREVRRLKRLPRLALALAMEAAGSSDQKPSSIFFSTSWGPLSETHDFLTKLFESDEQFTSPTDFVGSVHNAPAGQAAIWLHASGANITVTGGDYSFEQALFAAALAAGEEDLLIIGADEHHEILSPLFDGSARIGRAPSDGGGALCLKRATGSSRVLLSPLFFERSVNNSGAMESLMRSLGGPERVRSSYAAIFAGMPAAHDAECKRQLSEFISAAGFSGPVVDFRKLLGEFGSATSAAASIAARFAQDGALPPALAGGSACPLAGKGILMLGLGTCVTAIEIRA
jgi:3-oxoacyl-[acyl-carrier-protein] synthase-1/3-oxoacyl-[acyl-carrier-protein] synthase II